jgi:hypothetical protein
MNPRDLLRATKPGDARPPGGGRVQVLAALNVPGPDADTRRRLEGLGLHIEQVIGNKLVGTAPAEALDALRKDPAVAEVETSVRLGPHRKP